MRVSRRGWRTAHGAWGQEPPGSPTKSPARVSRRKPSHARPQRPVLGTPPAHRSLVGAQPRTADSAGGLMDGLGGQGRSAGAVPGASTSFENRGTPHLCGDRRAWGRSPSTPAPEEGEVPAQRQQPTFWHGRDPAHVPHPRGCLRAGKTQAGHEELRGLGQGRGPLPGLRFPLRRLNRLRVPPVGTGRSHSPGAPRGWRDGCSPRGQRCASLVSLQG